MALELVVPTLECGCDGRTPATANLGERAATVRVAVLSEPRTLLPALASSLVEGELADVLFDRLADSRPGASPFDDRAYAPGLAMGWRWSANRTVVTFTLDSAARWHDGAPVTSADVRFTFRLLRDPALGSRKAISLQAVDSVTTPDARTAVVWCHRYAGTLFHDLTFETHILPAHLLDTVPAAQLVTSAFARHPVGSGAFRFVRWDPGLVIRLDRYNGYRRAPTASRDTTDSAGVLAHTVVVRLYPAYDAALAGLLSHEVDVLGYVRPNDVARLARRTDLSVVSAPGYDYVYLLFNLRPQSQLAYRAPIDAADGRTADLGDIGFGDARLRRALAMAVNRRALAMNVLGVNGRVALGPVTRAMAVADTTPEADGTPAFDPGAARRALDALGWRPGPDGVRRRAGVRLAFDLLVPTSSASRRQAAVLLQAMFTAIGAQVTVSTADAAAFQSAMEHGAFDAALEGMVADPSPAQVREIWSTRAGLRSGREVAGFNYGGYANPDVDMLLDRAETARTAGEAALLYRRVYRILTEDAPAVFLYEPEASTGVSRRVVARDLQPEAWWTGIADWRLATRPDGRVVLTSPRKTRTGRK